MKLIVNKNTDNIEVIPSNFKDEKNPPKFIFRTPNSSDMLKFMWGGNAIDQAVYDCFTGFENKIELVGTDGKPIEYATYEQFVKAGLSDEIALIHNQCREAVANKLVEMVNEAKKTEKKSE